MLNTLQKLWHHAFLKGRPAVSLSLFRLGVAITVATHVIPTLLVLPDTYLSTALKEKNGTFFPSFILNLVEKSPDGLVYLMTGLFYLFGFSFLIGFRSQLSCILMTFVCYYFYALNSLHIGTLSWDILLVTLFLMGLTNYPGDFFSVDAWLRKKKPPLRPFFIQRLLQLQLAWTYFYTGLGKIYPGNWLQDNPYYDLMNYPPEGVIKDFWLRSFLAVRPELCYWLGIAVIAMEMGISVLLFPRPTRAFAMACGIFFHFLLVWTMHVPTIFFFLFIPQFLLFIPHERWFRFHKVPGSSDPSEEPGTL